jgi:hypothetical protein
LTAGVAPILEHRMKQHALGLIVASLIFASFTYLLPTSTSEASRERASSSGTALAARASQEIDAIDRFLGDGDFSLLSTEPAGRDDSIAEVGPILVTTRVYMRSSSPLSRQGSPGILEVRQEVFRSADAAERKLATLRSGASECEPYGIARQPDHACVVGSNVYLVRYGPFDNTQQGESLCASLWAHLAGLGPERSRA